MENCKIYMRFPRGWIRHLWNLGNTVLLEKLSICRYFLSTTTTTV